MQKEIHIGTSGWHYKHWMGNFYPPELKSKDFTSHYTRFFKTVEINNSFYRLPSSGTFLNWRTSVPDDFLFAVKANRFITHMKKLKDPQESLDRFFTNVNALGEKLGPILFQLPPGWKVDTERLQNFLSLLLSYYTYTFEFRHESWYTEDVLQLLRDYNVSFCIYELAGLMSPIEVTADVVYVRLHGPGGRYAGSYDESALRWWANTCLEWQSAGLEVFIYFDNDEAGYAAFNAQRLQELVQNKLM
ncbi:DUF72 domain-containing protein [Pontibacter locisalis]|uniref:DUF72 domain-containing protein n=1 Tax=Pontibacter locisalis TaxID=1719035 RepID=A0ABW5IQV3_9BACT